LNVAALSPEQITALRAELTGELERRQRENRLAYYKPYPRQAEFHSAVVRERLLMAANQSGKTYSAGMETALHLTGRYPDWWQGRRFDEPTAAWGSGVTSEMTRDTVQRMLVGRPGYYGTGTIPKDALIECVSARGIPDLLDNIKVRHVSGGVSILGFKSYNQGREKWQGETLDFVWFDEEPPADLYLEGLTRTNLKQGPVFVTFTPLLGMSEVVRRFLLDPSDDRRVITMTIEEAEHYTPEERARIIASYPEHEREARTKGVPALGSGRIFPVAEESLKIEPFDLPKHWPRIIGVDFGWDHPAAAVELAWDRDHDIVHVVWAHRMRQMTPIEHAAIIRTRGRLPVAWPRDGRRETLEGAGIALAKQYTDNGVNMLPTHSQFEDGSVSVEAGLMDILDRMRGDRFKVFTDVSGDWFEEFRLYHRKDGKVAKEGDDLMAATRYGVMMLREARVPAAALRFSRAIEYPKAYVA
jgi:phage terminase large subunit-like protein